MLILALKIWITFGLVNLVMIAFARHAAAKRGHSWPCWQLVRILVVGFVGGPIWSVVLGHAIIVQAKGVR